jgi:phospholipid/cholesterol/gamma-HCH transport system substrate-binding protein
MRRAIPILIGLVAIGLLFTLPSASGDDEGTYRVRAIFDNGSFLVPDEEVRIAGARVGLIESVDVTGDDEPVHADGSPDPGKAVVVLRIENDGFTDFRTDASCLIRPQSLIGERFVDCDPTQPRAPGSPAPPELETIADGEPGEGQRFLPVENNGKSVDLDLINNLYRAPYRDRFRIILNELGAGLAGRGDDLGAVIDRANPALRQTDRVLKILADQNDQLASLASDGDRVLAPLAENRTSITGFLTNARIAGEATAERSVDLEAQIQKLPETLRQIRLTMTQLKGFADEGTPLMRDVGAVAPSLNRATQKLAPFARAGVPALTTLGTAAEASGPKLVAADPVVVQTRNLTKKTTPAAKDLGALLDTFAKTNGFRYLMDFIYYTVGNINGYDQFGHFQRAQGIRTNCTEFQVIVFPSCEAFFLQTGTATQPTNTPKKKKKKGKGAAAAGGALGGAGDKGSTLLPPIEEIIPELDPAGPPAPDDGSGSPSDPPPADDSGPAAPPEAELSDTRGGGDPMTMRDASALLTYLLGGGA